MADGFVAEIRIFGGNFAPKGWASCDGQLLPISQNTALFSLLGTFYGGDGKSNFALPNMQGNAAMFWGQGPGLSDRSLGEMSGSQTVTLLSTEIPLHNHTLVAAADPGESNVPTNNAMTISINGNAYSSSQGNTHMNAQMLGMSGGSLPHNNMQPYLTLFFIVALQGIFPPRS